MKKDIFYLIRPLKRISQIVPMRKVGFCAEEEDEDRMKAPTPTRTWSAGMAWEWEALAFELGIFGNDRRFGCTAL